MTWRRTMLAIALAAGLASGAARAQTAEQAAFLFTYDVDRGQEAAFEAGYAAHLQWHAAHADALPWFGWYVTSGPRTGLFVDGTFGVPFAAMDRRPDPAGDGADMAARVLPYARVHAYSAHVLWPEPSTARSLEARQPSPMLDVYSLRVAPGDVTTFETALLASAKPGRGGLAWTWYRLAGGGAPGSYMVLVPRRAWADLAGRPADLAGLIAAAYGPSPDPVRAAALVQGVEVETWSYQPKLSRLALGLALARGRDGGALGGGGAGAGVGLAVAAADRSVDHRADLRRLAAGPRAVGDLALAGGHLADQARGALEAREAAAHAALGDRRAGVGRRRRLDGTAPRAGAAQQHERGEGGEQASRIHGQLLFGSKARDCHVLVQRATSGGTQAPYILSSAARYSLIGCRPTAARRASRPSGASRSAGTAYLPSLQVVPWEP